MHHLILGSFLVMSVASHASVYKCTNAAGKVSFQESPCAATESSREITLTSAQTVSSDNPLPQADATASKADAQRTKPKPAINPHAPGGEIFCKKLIAQYQRESQKVVAACKQARNNYCNQSAENIERRRDQKWLRTANHNQSRNYNRNNRSGSPLASIKEKIRLYSC